MHKDAYFYNFAQDEEIETVMVYQLINTPGVLRDVYMYSGIGGIGGTDGVNSIADGSYMFRLDIGELESKKEKHCERAVSYRMGKSRKK